MSWPQVPDGQGGFTKQSSVDRTTSNKALEAYRRRHVFDERKGKGRAEGVTGGVRGDDRGPPPRDDTCRDFQRGNCTRENCRFSHVGPGGGGYGGGGGGRYSGFD